MMLGLELDQDFAVLGADVVGRKKRDRIRLRQIDVVAYLLQLIGGNYLPDRALDIVDNNLSPLDPRSARRAHVEFHESGVNRRKEILAGDVQQRDRPDDHQRGAGQRQAAMFDESGHARDVMLADALEAGFEPAQETLPEAVAMDLLVFVGQQVRRHRGDQRAREQVRGQHREHDGECERSKQKSGDSRQQHDRKKHDADGKRADEGRRGDLMRAVQNRDQQRLVHRVIAMDVLDLDGCVIDQHPDRKRNSAQRHRVDRLAGKVQANDRGKNRERNRRDNDQHAARAIR